MDRQPLLTASVYDGPKEQEGFTLYPATLSSLAILEDKKNPALTGKEITMRAMSELAFVFTTDPATLNGIPDADWKRAVLDGVAVIDGDKFAAVQKHIEVELEKFMAAQAAPAGKAQGSEAPVLASQP